MIFVHTAETLLYIANGALEPEIILYQACAITVRLLTGLYEEIFSHHPFVFQNIDFFLVSRQQLFHIIIFKLSIAFVTSEGRVRR